MQGTESAKEELAGNTKLSHRLKEIIYACYKQFSKRLMRLINMNMVAKSCMVPRGIALVNICN